MPTKKLKTSPSFGDLVPLAWAHIPLYKWSRVHFTLSFLQASLHLTKDSSDMVFAMNQKEGKLFTWMSSVWDSSSKPRMRQGNCQRCRRSAWTTTASLFQAFLQQDNTRQISVSTSVTKSFTFTFAKTKICFCVFKIIHPHVPVRPACSPPSSFLQPRTSVLRDGSMGKARGAATSLYRHSQTKTVAKPKLEVLTSAFLKQEASIWP